MTVGLQRSRRAHERNGRSQPIAFMRGGNLFQIARSPDGQGYVGYRDGRVVGRGSERGEVARRLLALFEGAGPGDR